MGRSVRTILLGGLIALVAAGACGGDTEPAATEATVSRQAATTAPADPYAVPSQIDAAYLNRVFAALEKVDGDATRLIVAGKNLVPEAAKRLRAIYAEDEFQAQVDLWLDLVHKNELGRSRENPGDRVTKVTRIVNRSRGCVYVAVARDYSAIIGNPEPTVEYVGLRPADDASDPFQLNPTPWMIFFDGSNRDGSAPEDPCA